MEINEIVSAIESLTLIQASELVKALEEKFGTRAAWAADQQEMLRRYYDAQNGAGFDYAYRWPGMNKVLQAAGRVIRTQEDKGVVLLLDDRFAQSEYARLFPKHWRHLEYLRDTKELKKKLAEFWGE